MNIIKEKVEIDRFREIWKGSAIPTSANGYVSYKNEIVTCDRCKGIGFMKAMSWGGCDDNRMEPCRVCEGDGRFLKLHKKTVIYAPSRADEEYNIPLSKAKDFEPYAYRNENFNLRIDRSDKRLERKYPELKESNYDAYDQLIEKYKVLDILESEVKE